MIDLLVSRWGFSEIHAYMLCSVALKLRLSQVVNEPVHTVSAALSKQILPARELFPNPMTINDPEVVAELQALYSLYEHALVTNDVEKLVEMFWAGPR